MPPVVRIVDATDARTLAALAAPVRDDPAVVRRVARIVEAVRRGGGRALARYARRLDGIGRAPVEVGPADIARAARLTPPDVRRAIRQAARHIRRVALRQLPRTRRVAVTPGVEIELRVEPIRRVGCYVPGGRYPLVSSLLMTVVPARVAGVREVVVACPRPAPAVLYAAAVAGADRIFRIGGAHAIAALAFGAAPVPRVDKIVGPGNRYVAAAKMLVAPRCAIDFFAGPTELVAVAAGGRPDWIAADLAAQAEHDPGARALLLT
ncbi:MAG TPA: histidinol dehydrogenase, partial [Vicinamibacterales bacterium]|nr:histidinol dehydrogenase [Vicinamibacterales bacterium]